MPRTARESHYDHSGHGEKPICRDVMAPRRREIVTLSHKESSKVELGDFSRFSRDCRERVPGSHQRVREDSRPKRPLFRSTNSTLLEGLFGDPHTYRPCANVPCVFACQVHCKSYVSLETESLAGLPGSCWLDRPGDGSTRFVAESIDLDAVMHLAHVGCSDLAPAASCGGALESLLCF